MAGQRRPLFDFEDKGDNWKRVDPAGVAPIVAVPTTAGTGSEVGRASVILDEATHIKKIIFQPKMLPETVIHDPELTVGLPQHITAATGLRSEEERVGEAGVSSVRNRWSRLL